MQKSKLGISVGLAGAILYFLGLFSGYFVTAVAVAYVLITEENVWLRKTAAKVIVLTLIFPAINLVIGLIPDLLACINKLPAMFDGDPIDTYALNNFFGFLTSLVNIIKNVIFLLLGLMAFGQKTIAVPGVDSSINKHMN